MKNRYDYLKKTFTGWLKLKNKTRNVYNHVTNMFNLSEEEWQLEIKSNKNILSLRSVHVDQQARYRGRAKGECFQNVLGICDFDMIFTFVWAGWEGIAHDSRVLKEIAFNPTSGFPFPPPDKYYLCDAAYTNTRGFLAPYRSTRYWLSDYRRRRAITNEEKFNHAYAQLRNVIERAYGVLKARFPILKQMAPYPFAIQRDIVVVCFAIHNFIRKYNIYDELFMNCDENTTNTYGVEGGKGVSQNVYDVEWGSEDNGYMANLHDQIANNLFSVTSNKYIARIIRIVIFYFVFEHIYVELC